MASFYLSRKRKAQRRQTLQGRLLLAYEGVTALFALANFGIVLFNYSYIPLRDFWLQGKIEIAGLQQVLGDERDLFGLERQITISVPILSDRTDSSFITRWYDPIKGIEPNRETERYLDLVDQVRSIVTQRGLDGLNSQQSEQILADLRMMSSELIDTDPFQVADKSGRLAQIQNRMQEKVSGTLSAKAAFDIFWSVDYLSQQDNDALTFFQQRIRPLFNVNYFRPIGETGAFVDYFAPRIDFYFVTFFFFEFLVRTFFISRRHAGLSWYEAFYWRWYDVLLFLPFLRILRIIPVTIRLNEADVVDLTSVQAQISQGFVASFAEDLTQVIVIRVMNQIQGSIDRGDLSKLIPQSNRETTYIDLNNVNEVEEIINLFIELVIYKVLPKIQPEVEALLRYNLERILTQVPGSQNISVLPGFSGFPSQLSEQLAEQFTEAAYRGLTGSFEDEQAKQLTEALTQRFSDVLMTELREKRPLNELRELLVDFLEEVKLNYIERLSQEDVEDVLEQTRQLRQQARTQ